MKEKNKVLISVHGLGVPYTHVRISSSPKYYFDKELKKSSICHDLCDIHCNK